MKKRSLSWTSGGQSPPFQYNSEHPLVWIILINRNIPFVWLEDQLYSSQKVPFQGTKQLLFQTLTTTVSHVIGSLNLEKCGETLLIVWSLKSFNFCFPFDNWPNNFTIATVGILFRKKHETLPSVWYSIGCFGRNMVTYEDLLLSYNKSTWTTTLGIYCGCDAMV